VLGVLLVLVLPVLPAAALSRGGPEGAEAEQSPNTATISVIVSDQTGGAIVDATVAVTNAQTGFKREVKTIGDGSATLAALPIAGTYVVGVTKRDCAAGGCQRRAAAGGRDRDRARHAARQRRKNRRHSVRNDGRDPRRSAARHAARHETGRRSPAARRKIGYLPLLNAAFRPARGTGDLFVNTVYSVTGAGGRRETAVTTDGATNDDPWGRQAMMTTVPSALSRK
jgi:hypothetical protein